MGEGMRIHISSISKELLDMVACKLTLITSVINLASSFSQQSNLPMFYLSTRLGASDATTEVLWTLG